MSNKLAHRQIHNLIMDLFSRRQVLAKLCENRKIAQATHNLYAYRIYNEETKMWLQDCEDDGEDHAGGRVMHLLQVY